MAKRDGFQGEGWYLQGTRGMETVTIRLKGVPSMMSASPHVVEKAAQQMLTQNGGLQNTRVVWMKPLQV